MGGMSDLGHVCRECPTHKHINIHYNVQYLILFKWGQYVFLLLFSKDAFNLLKVTVKAFSNKCSSIELSIHQRILKKWFPQKYEAMN